MGFRPPAMTLWQRPKRRQVVAAWTLITGLPFALWMAVGPARAAGSASPSHPTTIEVVPMSPGLSLLGVRATYDAAPRGKGQGGAYFAVIDLKTGQELLRENASSDIVTSQVALSPNGRLAVIATSRASLAEGGWYQWKHQLDVWDLSLHKRIYSGMPVLFRANAPTLRVGDLAWSRDSQYLAFTMIETFDRADHTDGLYLVKPDGSGLRELAAKPRQGNWAWSMSEDVIYASAGPYYCQVSRLCLDGGPAKPIWGPEAPPMYTITSLLAAGVSPDGRWLTVETETSVALDDADVWKAAIEAVRTEGRGSVPLGSWSPVPHPLPSRGEKGRMVGAAQVKVAWSSDSSALYALVSIDEKSSRLYRWRPGEPSLAVLGADLPFPTALLTALPGSSEMLVWPSLGPKSVATHGALIVNADGRTRLIPSAAEALAFVNDNHFATVDEAGRLITIAGKQGHQSIRATDLSTGKSLHIYP